MDIDMDSLNSRDDAHGTLEAALNAFGDRIALACSFSKEDIVVIHLLRELTDSPRIFAIDTGRLHESTYECADRVRFKFGVDIEWYFPKHEAVEALTRAKGLFSFRESLENRHECCRIRKVEPLTRALQGLDAWITGLRRDQAVTRSDLQPVSVDDANNGITKISPLASWTEAAVDEYIAQHRLLVNRLHELGYPSIGCAPCTRAVEAGEDPRSGRWWWENPEHKECGLHQRHPDEEGPRSWTI